ncbi:coiled-coil domain-containing protein 43 [Ascaphus truei]|uniref:coiled-coil domain-containing protein 43 n=1 Tax=Ascaphus truei TaxID=8439 RepID=UPI003F5A86B6
MAAPSGQALAAGFASWLERRLEALGMDPDVYPAYIQGVLEEEEESPGEREEALRGVLAAFLEEDDIEDVCQDIINTWCEAQRAAASLRKQEDELQALTSLMEKQAQIVMKTKDVSDEEQKRKAALLAQYANVTDDEDAEEEAERSAAAAAISVERSLFKNTNLDDVLNARKLERDGLRDASQKKKDQDKQQREKEKVAKQERKEKEKKRTQKGERKR